jgi:hypothetical protein
MYCNFFLLEAEKLAQFLDYHHCVKKNGPVEFSIKGKDEVAIDELRMNSH